MDEDFLSDLEWLDNYDYCYECQGLGDDYYFDDNGELVCACFDCEFNSFKGDGRL